MDKVRFDALLAHFLNGKRDGYGTGRRRKSKSISYNAGDGFLLSIACIRAATGIQFDSVAVRFAVQVVDEMTAEARTPNGETEG